MSKIKRRATSAGKLVIISSRAGSMTPQVEAKIRKAFADALVVEFDPKMDIERLVTPRATVIVAGGDGTVEWVVGRLVDGRHPLGIISMGTFNNFARALRLPTTVDAAIRVVKTGTPRPITLGRVNGKVFLEAAALGLFGETIAAGDAAKDRKLGAFAVAAKKVVSARPFKYELSGDIKGRGTAMSLVFTITSSIGAQLKVGYSSPVNTYLELSIEVGSSRSDIVKRAIARAVERSGYDLVRDQVFEFRKLQVTTVPKVPIYLDNERSGRTPASLSAELSAVKVILPRKTLKPSRP